MNRITEEGARSLLAEGATAMAMPKYFDADNDLLHLRIAQPGGIFRVSVADKPSAYYAADGDTLSKWLRAGHTCTCPNSRALVERVRELLFAEATP